MADLQKFIFLLLYFITYDQFFFPLTYFIKLFSSPFLYSFLINSTAAVLFLTLLCSFEVTNSCEVWNDKSSLDNDLLKHKTYYQAAMKEVSELERTLVSRIMFSLQ